MLIFIRPPSPVYTKISYGPSTTVNRSEGAWAALQPHLLLIHFLLERFDVSRHRSRLQVDLFIEIVQKALENSDKWSTHPVCRGAWFRLLVLAMRLIQNDHIRDGISEHSMRRKIYNVALRWFHHEPAWSDRGHSVLETEVSALIEFYNCLLADKEVFRRRVIEGGIENAHPKRLEVLSTDLSSQTNGVVTAAAKSMVSLPFKYKVNSGTLEKTQELMLRDFSRFRTLLLLFVGHEIDRLHCWQNPRVDEPPVRNTYSISRQISQPTWKNLTRVAWKIAPVLALQIKSRFPSPSVETELRRLVRQQPLAVINLPNALPALLIEENITNDIPELKYVLFWAPVPPMTSLSFFLAEYHSHPLVLQYAVRCLRSFPPETILFYIPQVVQSLRHDERLGFVKAYILAAAQTSPYLAHQFIWNMKANMYVDGDEDKPDLRVKPLLDAMIDEIIGSVSGEDRLFYEKEFEFFRRVTGISGRLKPYLKKSKTEKKKVIDSELASIKVEPGVYLPCDPDSEVIGIDYKSGRPLQSHAKAPFLATFKVKRPKPLESVGDETLAAPESLIARSAQTLSAEDIWQSCIFKVGDDCRQDVLALQLIALFKNIFASVGLDLYLYPYRVVATAPGVSVALYVRCSYE